MAGVGEPHGLRALCSRCQWRRSRLLVVVFLPDCYRRVERFAIAVGLFELAFFFVAWAAHPDAGPRLLAGSIDIPFRDPQYLYLAAANIGAVDHAVDGVLPAVGRRR